MSWFAPAEPQAHGQAFRRTLRREGQKQAGASRLLACTYCFARRTHTYLGMNAGADFPGENWRYTPSIPSTAPHRAEPHRLPETWIV